MCPSGRRSGNTGSQDASAMRRRPSRMPAPWRRAEAGLRQSSCHAGTYVSEAAFSGSDSWPRALHSLHLERFALYDFHDERRKSVLARLDLTADRLHRGTIVTLQPTPEAVGQQLLSHVVHERVGFGL